MAELSKSNVSFCDTCAELTFTVVTGSDSIALDNADGRVTLVIKNANTQDAVVTLKAGNGSLSSLGDVAVPVSGGKIVAVPISRVDSARVKVLTGSNKGKMLVSSSVADGGALSGVSVAVLSVE